MIPLGGVVSTQNVKVESYPSKTYRLDVSTGQVVGTVDNIEAVKQAVFKILSTERYRHPIYSFNYGFEMDGLIGMDPLLLRSELQRRIQEALLQDDRITRIDDMQIEISGDNAVATFTVITKYGDFQATKGVMGSV
ncbi:DUF2634 domain-containing protein [Heliophilum fasciatum]|uniref:Uncharacterized protein DUF2634 n=1 Tax=Heliophilum fasciatum TaxID=35700 RepID=A0A4R2RPX4_9FIRM|nr:DUF2634 domain-containing protein [Heliophilum fasciatum]MCW2277726.1 hypothetical protein [Heliophilum fasciatum]TCP64779.1 uncharacterized protein DUF2634 [Heliophilum fasciatum]